MLQWYEAVNKHSVEELFEGAAEVDTPRLQPVGHGNSERADADADQGMGAPISREQTALSPLAEREPMQQIRSKPSVQDPEEVEQQLESK